MPISGLAFGDEVPDVGSASAESATGDEVAFGDGSSGNEGVPSEYYLTNLGFVTPAKLQSPWGTCWAFAVASAIESSILKASAELSAALAGQEAPLDVGAASAAGVGEDASSSADTGVGVDAEVGEGVLLSDHPMAAIRSGSVSAQRDDGDPSASSSSALSAPSADASASNAADTALLDADMSAPDFSKLSRDIDISERAIGWYAHEPQTDSTGSSQAGEGFIRQDSSPLSQFEGGNFSIATAALVARQSLLLEEDAPYLYNGYDGGDVAWFRSGSGGDARQKDWSLPADLRTSEDVGWFVSGVVELESPAIMETDMSNGMSIYKGYNASATQKMKQTIMDVGALAVCLNSELSLPSELNDNTISENTLGQSINYSTWSQYNGSDTFMLNHAVSVVGWDDSYPASAFRNASGLLPEADGAWLCKNNWGNGQIKATNGNARGLVDWGIRSDPSTDSSATGFFWLSFYDHTISTPVAFEVSPEIETNLYQYDYLGASEFFTPTAYTSDVLVSNVFHADKTEVLEAVAGWTFGQDETIHTYVYSLDSSGDISEIDDGESFKQVLASAELLAQSEVKFSDAGYHTIRLDSPVLLYEGETFAVIQQVDTITTTYSGDQTPGTYLNLEVAFTDTFDYESATSVSNVVSNDGETFISVFGPEDWKSVNEYNDWYADLRDQGNQPLDMIFGNALVKAISKDSSMASEDRVYEHVELEPVLHGSVK